MASCTHVSKPSHQASSLGGGLFCIVSLSFI
jgi:hypothetical protein